MKVSVSDTGPGIPAEYHIEVFDDFFRLPGNEAKLKAWVWDSPSRAVWLAPWGVKFGWKVNWGRARNSPLSFP